MPSDLDQVAIRVIKQKKVIIEIFDDYDSASIVNAAVVVVSDVDALTLAPDLPWLQHLDK